MPKGKFLPSSWFLSTLTASSVRRPAGLLHPAPDPGVRRVPPFRSLSAFASENFPSPATLHPSKFFLARGRPSCFHGPPGLFPSCRPSFFTTRLQGVCHLAGLPPPILLSKNRYGSTSLGFFFISSLTSSSLRFPSGSSFRSFLSRGPLSLALRCRRFWGSVRLFSSPGHSLVARPRLGSSWLLPLLGLPRRISLSWLRLFRFIALFRFHATFRSMFHLGDLFPRVVFPSAIRGPRLTSRFSNQVQFEGRGFATNRILFADSRRLHVVGSSPYGFRPSFRQSTRVLEVVFPLVSLRSGVLPSPRWIETFFRSWFPFRHFFTEGSFGSENMASQVPYRPGQIFRSILFRIDR